MSAVPLPSHDALADLFLTLGALQPPAELHGFATGQLAAGARLSDTEWLREAVMFLDCEEPDTEQRGPLLALYQTTRTQLEGGQMELELLLPEDEFDLVQRIESLGQWCQGFLAGFALAGKYRQQRGELSEFSKDMSEVLSDLANISQVGMDEDETDTDTENQLFAVCEYVRMAAVSVFLECNANVPPAAATSVPGSERLH